MNQKRYELIVGVFIFGGLALMALMVLLLSKGTAFRSGTFELYMNSGDVGGIKTGANVLFSGVSVGRVSSVELNPDGKSVTIGLNIYQKYHIYEDAQFSLEKFGFLGDQYVSIQARENTGRLLKNGDVVQCVKPFNMQEAIARATETISNIGQTATNANQAISDVRRYVLTAETLKNLGAALDHFSTVASQGQDAVSNVNALVEANAQPLTATISNLNLLASDLTPRVSALFSNNEPVVTEAVANLRQASISLTNVLHDLEAHKGLAGQLLSDERLARNFSELASNLASVTSTLDRKGLWGIMWAKKTPKADVPASSDK